MLVSDTLLDKAGLISWVLNLSHWSLVLRSCWLFFLDKANFRWERWVHLNVFVLTNKFCWSIFWFSDLKEAVTCMNSIALTIFANVVIWADWAHVTNTFHGCHSTAVANDILMNNVGLFEFLLFQEVLEHALESFEAIVSYFTFHSLSNGGKLFRWKNSGSTTFSAGQTLFVDLGAIALDAGDFSCLNINIIFLVRHNELAISLSIGYRSCHLNSHSFCFSCKSVICSISNGGAGLSSKRGLLYVCLDLLFASIYLDGVWAHTLSCDKVIDISASFDSSCHRHISTNTDLMLNWSFSIWNEIHSARAVEFAVINWLEFWSNSECTRVV